MSRKSGPSVNHRWWRVFS